MDSKQAKTIADFLGEVKDTTRVRSGLAYFDFVFTIAAAAGVPHFFVLVDQLEAQGILVRVILKPNCVRVCVHYFTTEAEADRLVAAIAAF